MAHFYYDVVGKEIDEFNGEVHGPSPDFKHYQNKSFGVEEIYYKVVDEKVTEVICEGLSEKSARKAVKEFLSNLG